MDCTSADCWLCVQVSWIHEGMAWIVPVLTVGCVCRCRGFVKAWRGLYQCLCCWLCVQVSWIREGMAWIVPVPLLLAFCAGVVDS